MLLPFWKKAISFLWPISIEKHTSQYNDFLEISINKGKLVLNSRNANYSFGFLHDVMVKVLSHAVLQYDLQPKNVLILGYGGGSVAAVVSGNFPNAKIIAVEIDPKVIEIAHKYFFTTNVDLVNSDAALFVANTDSLFDFIIIDVFIDVNVPEFVLQSEFLLHCKSKLTANGLCALNMLEPEKRFSESTQLYSSVFSNVTEFVIHGQNHLLFGTQ